jgi:hypothetical protein
LPSLANSKLPSLANSSSWQPCRPWRTHSPPQNFPPLPLCCRHWRHHAGVVAGHAGIVALVASTLPSALQWYLQPRHNGAVAFVAMALPLPCRAGVCPLMMLLAMHGSTLHESLSCLSFPACLRHRARRHCHRGVVIVIYVGQRGHATCLAASDGPVCSGTALLSCMAASTYPVPSSLYMLLSSSSTSAGTDIPIALPRRPALFVLALPGIELVVALVVLAYSPSLRAGVFALHALASSPQSRWLLPHCNAAQDKTLLHSWRLSWHCTGVLACIALTPCRHCASDIAPSHRHPRQHCVGVVALHARGRCSLMLVSLP